MLLHERYQTGKIRGKIEKYGVKSREIAGTATDQTLKYRVSFTVEEDSTVHNPHHYSHHGT